MSRGLFVTLEGPEGGGKSTLISRLEPTLKGAGREVVATREPGGTAAAERIRGLLVGGGASEMHDRCELLLMLAARADHCENLIRPALERGAVVLCDRFADSTMAYQGAARGLDRDLIRRMNAEATAGLVPDLTLLIDIDPALGLERAKRKGPDRIEAAGLAFHERVRQGYLDLAREEPDRFLVLDGAAPLAEVFGAAEGALRARL